MDTKKFKGQIKALEVMSAPMKPRLEMSTEDLEAIDEWDVGEEYDILCTVKMIGKHQRGKEMTGEFEVVECEEA